MLFCIVSSGSVTNFFPAVVRTLGYDDIITLLLTSPPYVLAVFATLLNAWHADKTGERYLHVILPLCVAMGAYILAASTTALVPRYFAMMLMVRSFQSPPPKRTSLTINLTNCAYYRFRRYIPASSSSSHGSATPSPAHQQSGLRLWPLSTPSPTRRASTPPTCIPTARRLGTRLPLLSMA